MKTQYKTAILSIVALIITLVAAFFLTLYSFKFIAKWFDFLNAIIIGVLSSAILLFFSSLINFRVIQKSNARSISALIYKLRNDVFYLYRIIRPFKDNNNRAIIPERYFAEVEALLLSLKETLYAILSAEKVSPLASKTIDFLNRFASKFAKDENEFFKFCSFLSDIVSNSYHSIREARYTPLEERVLVINISKDLDEVMRAFEKDNRGYVVLENFQSDLKNFVNIKDNN